VVEGALSGMHRSPHHGSSVEFAEHKEYTAGDEIKHIDWKAYGKFDRYYIKRFERRPSSGLPARRHLGLDGVRRRGGHQARLRADAGPARSAICLLRSRLRWG